MFKLLFFIIMGFAFGLVALALLLSGEFISSAQAAILSAMFWSLVSVVLEKSN